MTSIPKHIKHNLLAKEIEQWTSMLMTCLFHLGNTPLSTRLDTEKDLTRITDIWRDRFYELTVEEGNNSLSDLLFVLRCHLQVCNLPGLRTPLKDLTVENKELSDVIRYHLMQHRPDQVKEKPYLNDAEWRTLWLRVARYVTQAPLKIEPPHVPHTTRLSETLERDFQLLPVDPKNREVALKSKALGITASSGKMWITSLEDLQLGFVKFASRLFAKVAHDRALRTLYPWVIVTYDKATALPRWYQYVLETCSYDLGDEFIVKYHEASSESLLPIGARDSIRREALTQDDVSIAGALLENELGIDTCTAIQELQNRDYHKHGVSANPEDLMYPWLSLCLLGHNFLHNAGVQDFWETYFIPPANVFVQRERFGKKRRPLCGPNRPIITMLEQRVVIHNYGHWVQCENMVDAILKFLSILLTQHKGLLADDTIVLPLCQQMLL